MTHGFTCSIDSSLCYSGFNSERRERARRIEVDFFDMIDSREPRAGQQLVLELFHIQGRAFGQHFDATVIEVLHVTDNLMSGRRALGEETITHALHAATDEKLTSNRRHIHGIEFNTEADFAQCEDRENHFDTYHAAVVIVGDWDKVKDQVTPFGDVTIYDANGNVITK